MTCDYCSAKNAQQYWEKSEKKDWFEFESPFVYSDLRNEYYDEDTLIYEWEKDFSEEFNLAKAAEYYRLYVCKQYKPRLISLLDEWCDYLPSEIESEPPKGWREVENVYNDYLENCGPFSYTDTQYGLKI